MNINWSCFVISGLRRPTTLGIFWGILGNAAFFVYCNEARGFKRTELWFISCCRPASKGLADYFLTLLRILIALFCLAQVAAVRGICVDVLRNSPPLESGAPQSGFCPLACCSPLQRRARENTPRSSVQTTWHFSPSKQSASFGDMRLHLTDERDPC